MSENYNPAQHGYYQAEILDYWIGQAGNDAKTNFLEVRCRTIKVSEDANEVKGPYTDLDADNQVEFTASSPITAKTVTGKSLPLLLRTLGHRGDVKSFLRSPGLLTPAGRKAVVEMKEGQAKDRSPQDEWRILWSADRESRFKRLEGEEAASALAALADHPPAYDPTANEATSPNAPF